MAGLRPGHPSNCGIASSRVPCSNANTLVPPAVHRAQRDNWATPAYVLATTDAGGFYGFHKHWREAVKRLRFEYFAMSDGKTQDIQV